MTVLIRAKPAVQGRSTLSGIRASARIALRGHTLECITSLEHPHASLVLLEHIHEKGSTFAHSAISTRRHRRAARALPTAFASLGSQDQTVVTAVPVLLELTRTRMEAKRAPPALTTRRRWPAAKLSRRASAMLAFLKRTEETAPCAMPANTSLTPAMPTVLRVPTTHNLWPGAPQSPTAAAILVTLCRTTLPIMTWRAPPASLASSRTRLVPRTVPNACATHTILIMRA